MKRRLSSTSLADEPFDCYKRRRIEELKSNNPAVPKAFSRGNGNDHTGLDVTVSSYLFSPHNWPTGRELRRVKPSKDTNQSISVESVPHPISDGKNGCRKHLGSPAPETQPEEKPRSSSHRQLELTISDGIKSPTLPSKTVDTKERSISQGKPAYVKPRHLRHEDFSNLRSKSKPSRPTSEKRAPGGIRHLHLWYELLQPEKKFGRMPPQDDKKCVSLPRAVFKTEDDESNKRSCKKPQKLFPLPNLLISGKEYYNLSILTPIALEREERYNWGHVKKSPRVKNKIMRSKLRVLDMSSQAPVPSPEVLDSRFRTNTESSKKRSQLKPSCKPKSSARANFPGGYLGSHKPAHLAPPTEASNPRESAANNDHLSPSMQTERRLITDTEAIKQQC
ncbi:hypothetical protein PSTG_17657 [Puccinia striiformis f. sp. tritici PST-78]|uniref:Uncharacterized protein n=1 Tax=Puccinia striiformis f. sp. tritici PST-78 TaxID=1165861 RepID=A0A0L0UPM9_9BASI|nr:hypothetical protein PSTG_17657 [Puccinia striiformis f. sp. tritici PST-78]